LSEQGEPQKHEHKAAAPSRRRLAIECAWTETEVVGGAWTELWRRIFAEIPVPRASRDDEEPAS